MLSLFASIMEGGRGREGRWVQGNRGLMDAEGGRDEGKVNTREEEREGRTEWREEGRRWMDEYEGMQAERKEVDRGRREGQNEGQKEEMRERRRAER